MKCFCSDNNFIMDQELLQVGHQWIIILLLNNNNYYFCLGAFIIWQPDPLGADDNLL